MSSYLKRLFELASVAFVAGASEYVGAHGFDLSQASLQGLGVAGGVAAYGVIIKAVGDKERPTIK